MLRIHASQASALAGLLLIGASIACSDATGTARAPVSLSLSGVTSTTPAAAVAGAQRTVTITSGANTIVITKAQVVLARIELAQSAAASCVTTDDDTGCEEMKLDPMLVDLPVTTTVIEALSVAIPAGTYSELEAKIRVPRSGEAGSSALLTAHPEFAGKSVHVEGTYNGAPFVYDGNVEASLELAFNPPLTVASGGTNNVSVHVDLSTWFTDGSGNAIDPRNTANASRIADNIKRSFHAFEDRDRNGIDD